MPVYDYACPACGYRDSFFRKIAQLDDPLECPKCAATLERLITAPMIRGDYEPYDCPITGKRIEGKRAHIENLKRHGCRVLEPGETREFMKGAQRRREEADRAIEKLVERTAHEMGIT